MVPASVYCVILMLMSFTHGFVFPVPTVKSCEYNGHVIPEAGQYKPTECMTCSCHKGTVECLSEPCMPPKCVDAVHVTGICCPQCPNGPNCYLGKEIIPGDGYTYKDEVMTCSCSNDRFALKAAVCVTTHSPIHTDQPN